MIHYYFNQNIIDNNYIGSNDDLLLERNKRIIIEKKVNKNALNFIDLFSGAGGIGIGFEQAGFEHILSSDFDEAVAKTFIHNNNVPFVKGDLSEPKIFNKIKNIIGDKSIDVLVGGPPCQGFSMFGRRRFVKSQSHDPFDDIRNDLIFTYLIIY